MRAKGEHMSFPANTLSAGKWLALLLGLILVMTFGVTAVGAQQWIALGPDGGDARSLAYDPRNPDDIFLGTNTGTIFLSTDGGLNWSRFAHLGQSDDYVLDHIVIDRDNPDIMLVSAWSVHDEKAGDLFRSRDRGATWGTVPALHGKAIRALVTSSPDSSVITVGSLQGIYRSVNEGNAWQRISPENQDEIKNIESIAVDPRNPDVVYAGTWHLAWKTTDGGTTWRSMKNGMIDDSDVFSIIVDSTNSSVVLASACSGIYRSETAGDEFHKVQGIPFSARRTRVLKQDPSNPKIVYAGTTEGLWKTIDAGRTWKRMSDPEVVVNDILIDPRNSQRVLLATDRSGVLLSDDGAQTFKSSNHGYTHRYVTAIVVDKNNSGAIFAGVANDREWGGVFVLQNAEGNWKQRSIGLGGRDVFALKQASNGALIAGTNAGIFILNRNAKMWKPSHIVLNEPTSGTKELSQRAGLAKASQVNRATSETKVNDIDIQDGRWIAATSVGLFTSKNDGRSWSGGAILDQQIFVSVASFGNMEVAATRTAILVSKDAGIVWQLSALPPELIGIRSVTLAADRQIVVASRDGGFRSSDGGVTWTHMLNGLPDRDINSIAFDEDSQRLLATSNGNGIIFESGDGGNTWYQGPDTGYLLRHISVMRGRVLAATSFDGVIVQP
jgi:photosystem II stability/assembly factor-like uncharacterized protein